MCEQLCEIPGAMVKQCDATALPFEDQAFDCVIANHMLYHLEDPDVALKEFQRVLRPEGRLFVSLNGRNHMKEINEVASIVGRPGLVLRKAEIVAENGREYLERHFADVKMYPFPGDLEIPCSEPVLAYLDSLDDGPMMTEQRDAAAQLIEGRIANDGCFRIQKHVVLFTARTQ